MSRFLCAGLLSALVGLSVASPGQAQYYRPAPLPRYGSAPAYPTGPGYFDSADRQVDGWYRQYLRRTPDGGASIWIELLRSGHRPERVLSQILGSDEYYRASGNDPGAYIQLLFQDTAGRRPSDAEYRYHLNHLLRGAPREDVAFAIIRRAGG